MGFLPLAIVVWVAAMLGWYVISKYFKSSDADKIKQRLMGVGKAARQKAKEAKSGEQSVIHTQQSGNKFAQLLVEKYQLGPKMQLFLEQAGLKWTPARLIHLCIMAFAAGMVAAWVLSPLPLALDFVVGLVIAPFPFLYVWYQRRGRLRKFEAIFPETLEFISRSMRAGHAFSVSLEMIYREFGEPVSGEFRRTFEEANLGLPIEVALQGLAKRVPSLDVHFFVSAVLLQKRTGGNLAEILDKLAYVIRERFKLRGRIRAVSAHGRMTATILTMLPVCTMLALLFVAPGYLQGMSEDSDGKFLIGGAILAQVLGNFFIKKIINIKV